jgi:hypothetical protein
MEGIQMKEILKTFLSVAAVLIATLTIRSANAATPPAAEPAVFESVEEPASCDIPCPTGNTAFCVSRCGSGYICTSLGHVAEWLCEVDNR